MFPPALTAIEFSSLIQLLGNPLKASEKDHHVVPQSFPKGHKHHGRQRQQRIGQKVDGNETGSDQGFKPAIDQTVLRIQPTKGDGCNDDRHQHGCVERSSQPMNARQDTIDEDGQGQGTKNNRRHHTHEVNEGGA